MCFSKRRKQSMAKVTPAPQSDKASEMPKSVSADNVIFVLGGPGSGKGTQCAKLVEEFKVNHVSVGDLLRDEVASGSEVGTTINELMKEGKIVPFEVVLKCLTNALTKYKDSKCVLVDGFPREMQQGLEFEKVFGPVKAVFFFECTLELMEKRLLKRGETSGRADDNLETIKKRFQTFQDQSLPVVEYYEKQGRLVKISSEPSPEEVYQVVKQNFERIFGSS